MNIITTELQTTNELQNVKLTNVTYTNFHTKVFDGFYESNLFNSDTLYNINYDDTDIPEGKMHDLTPKGYKQFELDVCEKAVELLANIAEHGYCNSESPLYNFKFENLLSPQYYNYSTDTLKINMDVDLRALEKYCFYTNRDDFDKYLHDNYTSYDGFMPFIDNNLKGFKDTYYRCKGEVEPRELQVMIEYYIENMIDEHDEYEYKGRLYEYANCDALWSNIELVDKE